LTYLIFWDTCFSPCLKQFSRLLLSRAVMEPAVIQRQMLFQQFTMLKFFLSALATSEEFVQFYISVINLCMLWYSLLCAVLFMCLRILLVFVSCWHTFWMKNIKHPACGFWHFGHFDILSHICCWPFPEFVSFCLMAHQHYLGYQLGY